MPTLPGALVIAAGAILSAMQYLAGQSLPPVAQAIVAIGIPVLTYVAHLQTPAKRVRLVKAALAALVLVAGCQSCTAPSQAVVAPSIATAVCIMTTVSADVAAKEPWSQVVADTVAKCGTDAGTIAQVWGAHEKALVQQGFVPPPIAGRDGG